MGVNKVIVGKKQNPPVPGGPAEYSYELIPAGATAEWVLLVDGVEQARMGPWTATEKAGRSALCQARFVVSDSSHRTDLDDLQVDDEVED